MSGKYILDEHGNPVPCDDVITWAKWFEQKDSRRVAETDVNGVRVSTVFLGIDHDFGDMGAPVLWETMIFGGPHDQYQARYTSHDAAKAGHELAVLIAEGKTTPEAVGEVEGIQ